MRGSFEDAKAVGTNTGVAFLFVKYRDVAYISAFDILKDGDESDDVVSRLFARILRRDSLPEVVTEAYVRTAARREAMSLLRAERSTEDPEHISQVPDAVTPSALEKLIRSEEEAVVEEFLLGLPPRCQQVAELRIRAGLSTKRIAETLGVSCKAIEKQLARARGLLRLAGLGAHGDTAGGPAP